MDRWIDCCCYRYYSFSSIYFQILFYASFYFLLAAACSVFARFLKKCSVLSYATTTSHFMCAFSEYDSY